MTLSIRLPFRPDLLGTDSIDRKTPADTNEQRIAGVSAIILCGGKSKRMGRPKEFLPYNGKTLIEDCLDKLSELFAEVFLVSNNPELYEHLSANALRDIVPNRGPLVGILSGLLVSSEAHSFVTACDLPFVDKKLIKGLCAERYKSKQIIYRQKDLDEPLLGVYSRSCIAMLEEAIFIREKDSVHAFASENDALRFEADFDPNYPPTFNVDTPKDYSNLCLNTPVQ